MDPGKVEMIAARQNPLFLWNKHQSAKLQVFASSLKMQVTCASASLYHAVCFTMW